jgi:hypothetical protein
MAAPFPPHSQHDGPTTSRRRSTTNRRALRLVPLLLSGIAAAIVALPAAGASTNRAPGATAARAAVAHAVSAPPAVPPGVYLGVDPNFDPTHSTAAQASTFSDQIGRHAAIVSYYLAFGQSLPSGLSIVSDAGSLPMVSWKCGATDPQILAGKEDTLIKNVAEQYKAFARPVLVRWFWEMNLPNVPGNPYCLGYPNTELAQQQAGYVAAWKHIWTIFQQVGASNVGFVWCPSAAELSPPSVAAGFFPGKQYVNWVCGDIYDRPPSYTSFPTDFGPFYAKFSTYGLPMMVGETGAPGSSDQQTWLGGIETSLQTEFQDVHALVYVDAANANSGTQENYILNPGTPGMAQFATMSHLAHFEAFGVHADGFAFATAGGVVKTFNLPYYGDPSAQKLPAKIVGFSETPDGKGYWLVGTDGSIYAYGDAVNDGSMGGKHLNYPIVGMAASPTGGYWLVASDGGIFSFGGAKFHGSTGNIHLNKPIVGIAATDDGRGYWMVASDGGIFAFGDAKFRGSTGNIHLNKPIIGMSPTTSGLGYWLVASDGGVFTFGNAHFVGSLGGTKLDSPVAGLTRDFVTGYYLVVTRNGTVYQFPPGAVIAAVSQLGSRVAQLSSAPTA